MHMPTSNSLRRRVCAVALAVFLLAALVGCNAAPPANSTPPAEPENDTAAAVLAAYRQGGGEVTELGAATSSATVAVVDMAGTIPAYDLTQGNPPCAGYLQTVPSMIFTLAQDEAAVEIAFVGNKTATLIVVAEGDEIVCDENAPLTLTPQLILPQPKAGRYGVWVGRTGMDGEISGKLTVALAPGN